MLRPVSFYMFDTIHNCHNYVNQIMHVVKDFELSKTQISQHLTLAEYIIETLATLKCRNKGNFSK